MCVAVAAGAKAEGGPGEMRPGARYGVQSAAKQFGLHGQRLDLVLFRHLLLGVDTGQ